ncbi:HAD-IA family hydrolase [Mycobacterium sp. AT1]|uniref:HAD-IA family hydrolase n=1 Tax=Mycobacterium sp. AT1 TaxID=1961706 RepID=UPI0009D101E3|nr:HAD-IA family hydrolase [Mycobacterium sp. AT1]OPX09507.1 haloacid dehalogenase [Mycobacterium sp. AT1]
MTTPVKALIFDCDGVLADTERFGHLPAFNQTFREFDLPVQWTERGYGEKLAIGGGKERMMSLLTPEFVAAAKLPTDVGEQRAVVARWHRRKTEIYTEIVSSGRLPGRPGIARLIRQARASGWQLAVASTSAEPAVRSVLEHVVGREAAAEFVVLAGDVVAHKKPAPDIYLLALEAMRVSPSEVIVIEDSANGFRAARAAGIECLVTVNGYTRDDDFDGAALVVSDLGEPGAEPVEVLLNPRAVPVGDWVDATTVASLVT